MNRDVSLIFETYKNKILLEGNPVQQKFNKWLDTGYTLGIVSPESTEEHMLKAHDGSTKLAHEKFVKGLYIGRKQGHIKGWTGPHAGEYVYNPEPSSDPSEDQPLVKGKEGSYILIPNGPDEESTKKMIMWCKKLGDAFFQESIIVITPDKKAKYIYLKRRTPSMADFEKEAGDVHYNVPLATSTQSGGAGGRTGFKGSSRGQSKGSFTAF